jgi:phage terminase large subunit GpA-like protein
MPTLSDIRTAVLADFTPPPRLLVSEWSEQYRHLSAEASAEPGRWRNSRAPHLLDPMDRLSPYDPCERLVLKFSSQSGKTEIILNFIGYCIDLDPGPILAVQPNVDPMGESFSKDRISPMMRDSPSLREKVAPTVGRNSANTIKHKSFPGGHLTIAGANSPAGLASRPIRFFLGDEVDRWESTKEGDPMLLARKRQQTYRARRRSKELLTSSPTYDDIGISREYADCLSQYEWHLACLHCGETQRPRITHYQWQERDASTVVYRCEHCAAVHTLADEHAIKAAGRWVQTRDDGVESCGYWFGQWGSPFARWRDTVQEWIDAQGDSAKMQAVTNTVFAEGWEGVGDRADPHVLSARAEDYGAEVPDGVLLVTMGVA